MAAKLGNDNITGTNVLENLQKVAILYEEGKKKHSDWKSKLSGAFDNKRIFLSLIVLALFYVGYVLEGSITDNNEKDEDRVNEKCSCKPLHRVIYIVLFIFCSVLWFVLHTWLTFVQVLPGCDQWINKIKNSCAKFFKDCFCCKQNKTKQYKIVDNKEDPQNNKNNLKEYEKLLWFQYYKLNVVGYSEYKGEIDLNKMFDDVPNKDPVIEDSEQTISENRLKNSLSNTRSTSKFLIYAFLVAFQYFAQLLAIPFLIFQMFDSYTLLCFLSKSYCSSNSEYSLHLHQAIFTFAFYCCLGVSFLTSLLIQWDPWPQED